MTPSMEPVPVPHVPEKLRRVETCDTEKFKKALEQFKIPVEEDLSKREDNSIRQHPNTDIEGYFEWVSHHGKPVLSWDIIKPAFLWKLKFVMDEMIRLEQNRSGDKLDFSEGSDLKVSYDFIMEKAEEFDGAPFTWQRICELLHTPSRHYKRPEKFMRAMDKTINVVTTITEEGMRVTGSIWPMPIDTMNGRIEQQFFGKVDEVDGMDDDEVWDEKKAETTRPIGPIMEIQAEPLDMSRKPSEEDNGDRAEEDMETTTTEEEMTSEGERDMKKEDETQAAEPAEKEPMEEGQEETDQKSEPMETP